MLPITGHGAVGPRDGREDGKGKADNGLPCWHLSTVLTIGSISISAIRGGVVKFLFSVRNICFD